MPNIDLNFITGLIAAIIMLLLTRGYFMLVWFGDMGRIMTPLVRGTFLIQLGLLLRLVWWDGVRTLTIYYDPSVWAGISAATGGTEINAIFNTIAIVGGLLTLQARLMLIPDDDRPGWTLFTAVFYPYQKCVSVRAVSLFRRQK